MVLLVLLLKAAYVLFGDRQGLASMLHDRADPQNTPTPFTVPALHKSPDKLSGLFRSNESDQTRNLKTRPPFAVPALHKSPDKLSGSFRSNKHSQTHNTRKKTAVVQICLPYYGGYFASVLHVSQALLDFQLEAEHVCVVQNEGKRQPPTELEDQVEGLRMVRAAGVRIVEFYPEEFHQLHLAKFSPNMNLSNTSGKKFMDMARSKWAGRYDSFVGKLFIFGMDQYEKIVFLDNDIVVLKSLRELLEWPAHRMPAMAADIAGGTLMNTGVMVFRPDKHLVYEMMQRIAKPEDEPWRCANSVGPRTSCDTDQDFINGFFGENIHVLSPYWNILLSFHGADNLNPENPNCKSEMVAMEEPKSLKDWDFATESLGRKQASFHKWLWQDKDRWKRISLLHLAWPKVNWNLWSPYCDTHDEDLCPPEFDPGEHTTDNCDPLPPPIYTLLIRSGEPGLAVLSIYRNFWSRVIRRIERLCKSEFKLMEEFEVSGECMHNPDQRHSLGPDRDYYKNGANFSQFVYSFMYQEAGWDVFNLLLENPLIPEY